MKTSCWNDGFLIMSEDTAGGELIYYATKMGYKIGFYDESFLWRYEITLKERVKEIKCK